MNYSLGAVIVCVPHHLQYLDQLFDCINNQSLLFNEISFVASGFSKFDQAELNIKIQNKLNQNVILSFVPLGPAGKNRNIGWKKLNTDIVCFLDSDDVYYNERNFFINKFMTDQNLDLFIHSYDSFSNSSIGSEIIRYSRNEGTILTNKDFFHATFPSGTRQRDLETGPPYAVSVLQFTDDQKKFDIHHAHISVKREVLTQTNFHEITNLRNEDSVFVRDVLYSGKTIGVSSIVLSGYRTNSSFIPKYSIISKLRYKITNLISKN